MKPLCTQIYEDEIALGLYRELSDSLCRLLCVDRPLYCPPCSGIDDPTEEMLRVLLRYSVQSRAYAVRKLLQSRLHTFH